jgi:hypothetical protein
VLEGLVDGLPDGFKEGLAEGMLEGVLEGLVDGLPDVFEEGLVEGIFEGESEGEAHLLFLMTSSKLMQWHSSLTRFAPVGLESLVLGDPFPFAFGDFMDFVFPLDYPDSRAVKAGMQSVQSTNAMHLMRINMVDEYDARQRLNERTSK